ncbi:hypothetical protein HPB47_017390 [Ixodes persulcatus]|uniref:Uncharacterized protein n=1 Tax=Ixodes persulcatus TaxID=34615 RepID=A0AC60QRZ0_IXOPE|nr:hypothetical protein HPB47_017390 [Ixodes persulcatus]
MHIDAKHLEDQMGGAAITEQHPPRNLEAPHTFPECILEIRYNSHLNLVAVDVRNGQTTRGLLRCTELCGIKVRAYEPPPRHCATGVIKDVDTTLTDEEITNNLRSPENRVARLRRLVAPFQEKPVQCRKCCRYGHRQASYKHSSVCKRCGNTYDDRDSCTAQESPPQWPHCGDRPNLIHMIWRCQLIPAVLPNPNPIPTSWEERLTDDTATGQQSLVDRAKAVAATYGAPD